MSGTVAYDLKSHWSVGCRVNLPATAMQPSSHYQAVRSGFPAAQPFLPLRQGTCRTVADAAQKHAAAGIELQQDQRLDEGSPCSSLDCVGVCLVAICSDI